MRPPMTTTKNDGAPALHHQRKTQLSQKEVLAENQKKNYYLQQQQQLGGGNGQQQQQPVQTATLLNSESDDFLCFKSQPTKFNEFLAKRNSGSSAGSDTNSSIASFSSCQNYSTNQNSIELTSLFNPNLIDGDDFDIFSSQQCRSEKLTLTKNAIDTGISTVASDYSDNKPKSTANILTDVSNNFPFASSSSSTIKSNTINCNNSVKNNYKIKNQNISNRANLGEVPKKIFVNTFENFNRNYDYDYENGSDNSNKSRKLETIVTLPLSETEPLLTNIETTVADPKRSICLSKNSASLIFTKKDYNCVVNCNSNNSSSNLRNPSSIVHRRSNNTNTTPNSSSAGGKNIGANNSSRRNTVVPQNNLKNSYSNNNSNNNSKDALLHHRRSLQLNYFPISSRDTAINSSVGTNYRSNTASNNRKQHAYSWYAPVYSALEEEFEQESRDSSPIHKVANTQNTSVAGNETLETSSLLGRSPTNIGGHPQLHQPRIRRQASNTCTTQVTSGIGSSVGNQTQIVHSETEGPHAASLLGGPLPRRRRFENFLKSLVGRKPSKETASNPPLLPSPEIKVTHSPSDHNLLRQHAGTNEKITNSTTSLNSVHHKLWNVVPLLKREGSCTSLHHEKSNPLVQYSGLRKCETVLALSRSSVGVEPIKPLNRLRNSSSTSNANCSRCSSLLSLAASGSRYSLNLTNSGFVTVNNTTIDDSSINQKQHPTGKMNSCGTCAGSGTGGCASGARISGGCSSFHGSGGGGGCNESSSRQHIPSSVTASAVISQSHEMFTCKLCLAEVETKAATIIEQCGCMFCTECMKSYVEFEISEGAYEISCPDAQCLSQGIISLAEITSLASASSMKKHHRYRLNREIELDKNRTWCPRAGCETICVVGTTPETSSSSSADKVNLITQILCAVQCPTCKEEFCSGCKKPWHPSITCEENNRRLAAEGQDDSIGIPFDNDLIKYCPMCAVPIEKDEGCAQMMCKRCKHVFCWYCLASLDDDFLLRHYDKGPCKNKLGHSRASVVWHRAQVIGIFAGFGILLLVASPLLLLAAPCIICCKCRICNGSAKLDDADTDFDDAVALQR